uniref:protein xylosyltransferase n=1 Tax=Aceria tosichella TaxID=561515 RepID=A0A6G1S934_9ACAR
MTKPNTSCRPGRCSKYIYASLLLCLAVIIQLLFVYQFHDDQLSPPKRLNLTHEPDASSAIKRAKTDRCRQEFVQFVKDRRLQNSNEVTHEIVLKRTCPHDSESVQRVTRLGCSRQTIPSSNQSLYVSLEDNQTIDPESCKDYCFSFGHVYAAYNQASQKCYCADDDLINSMTLSSCDIFVGGEHKRREQLEWFRINGGIYNPNGKKVWRSTDNVNGEVRIAFLLSLHGRSLLQIRRLLKNIYSSRHIYYIHVDSREEYLFKELKTLQDKHNNILLSSQRFETIWGGTALLSMMINAMNDLSIYQWHYLINLSESDFLLKDLSDLETYLESNNQQSIYLKSHSMKGYNFVKKQGLNYDFYQCEGRVWRMGRRHLPKGIIYTGGSDWFGLPKRFCDYIIENKGQQDSLVNSLLQVFNFTLLPAESFFHTLAKNSEFCDNLVDNNLRITNWHRKQGCKCRHDDVVDWCGCSPRVYRWPDRQRLKQTTLNPSLFFSRKFDPTVSAGIIGFAETHLVHKVNVEAPIDTRYWLNVYQSPDEVLNGPYRAFSEFALAKTSSKFANFSHVKSIDVFFKEDQFVGLVYEYCGQQNLCNELMVSPKKTANLVKLDNGCFGAGLTLKSLEVNQGFDTNERLFRNFMPLDSQSDVVVHHVWLVEHNSTNSKDLRDAKFQWINPRGEMELVQDAKLRVSLKPSQLSLVHRLHKRKPMHSGLWKLRVNDGQRDCLDYQFLVFNGTSFGAQSISQAQFDEFYQVSHGCLEVNNSTDVTQQNNCEAHWSLKSRTKQFNSYNLTI